MRQLVPECVKIVDDWISHLAEQESAEAHVESLNPLSWAGQWDLGETIDPNHRALVTAANPADRGSRVTFFAAGLGAVTPSTPAGNAGTAITLATPRVFFDSYAAEVSYSGLVPSIAGRYQVTVRVPTLLSPATNISVSMTIGGFSSNRVTIPVR